MNCFKVVERRKNYIVEVSIHPLFIITITNSLSFTIKFQCDPTHQLCICVHKELNNC